MSEIFSSINYSSFKSDLWGWERNKHNINLDKCAKYGHTCRNRHISKVSHTVGRCKYPGRDKRPGFYVFFVTQCVFYCERPTWLCPLRSHFIEATRSLPRFQATRAETQSGGGADGLLTARPDLCPPSYPPPASRHPPHCIQGCTSARFFRPLPPALLHFVRTLRSQLRKCEV